MSTIVLAIVIVLASVAGLAAGVLLGRQPPRGSCSGIACIKDADCVGCDAQRAKATL